MSTIKIDKDDIVSCLSIHRSQLPEAMTEYMRYNVPCAYIDNVLDEHMYSEQNLIEEGMEKFVERWGDWIKEITKVMELHECSYFRLIGKAI